MKKKFNLQAIVRPHIEAIKPYSSARDEYTGKEGVFLDANENPVGSVSGGEFNRYPDPLQRKLKEMLGDIKQVADEQIFFGNGSDEAIDLLFRAFTVPSKDNIIIMPPTYGMYEVSASINDVAIKRVPLLKGFQLDVEEVLNAVDDHTKIIFICHPNNPTGNLMHQQDILEILDRFDGLVVVDEAYMDFAGAESNIGLLPQYPNLIVLQTFSKAWGLAALRLGIAYADASIIAILNKIKPPYNISLHTQEIAQKALEMATEKEVMVKKTNEQREKVKQALQELPVVKTVYPSDANFLLVQVTDAAAVYQYLLKKKIIVRDRSKVALCEGCLRITIGTEEENDLLLDALRGIDDRF